MPEEMKKYVMLMAAIAIVLVVIVIFCSSNSKLRKFFVEFLFEEVEGDDYTSKPKPEKVPKEKNTQKKTSEPQVEMATLMRKTDNRKHVIESTGKSYIEDEVYELVFKSRKGRNIVIECSKQAYESIPFNQQGSLTYKKNTLVKFKYFDGIVFNNPQ